MWPWFLIPGNYLLLACLWLLLGGFLCVRFVGLSFNTFLLYLHKLCFVFILFEKKMIMYIYI